MGHYHGSNSSLVYSFKVDEVSEDNEETFFLCHNKNESLSTFSSRLGSNFVSLIKPFQTNPASNTSATRDDNQKWNIALHEATEGRRHLFIPSVLSLCLACNTPRPIQAWTSAGAH